MGMWSGTQYFKLQLLCLLFNINTCKGSCLSIPKVIMLLKIDMIFFCCFAPSFQCISKLHYWLLWKLFIQPLYLIFKCALQKFSTQSLQQSIFNGPRISKILCIHHPDSICVSSIVNMGPYLFTGSFFYISSL